PRRRRQRPSIEAVQPRVPAGEAPADPAMAQRGGWMTELIFRDDAYARSCTARVVAADEKGVRLDRTVFYPTGGGQPGDKGTLRLPSGEAIAIVDAVKGQGLA